MSLDGLRAWIGVVERKLTMRTRVFLVLVAIAIGGAGAGIYLAIDARDSAVSEADLQAVRDELAVSEAATAGGDTTQLEAEIKALQAEVEALQSEPDAGGKGATAIPLEPAGGSTTEQGDSATRQGDASESSTPIPQEQDRPAEPAEQSGDDVKH